VHRRGHEDEAIDSSFAQQDRNQPGLLQSGLRRGFLNDAIGRHSCRHQHGAEHFAFGLLNEIRPWLSTRGNDQPRADQLGDPRPFERAKDTRHRERTNHLAPAFEGGRPAAQDDDRVCTTCRLPALEGAEAPAEARDEQRRAATSRQEPVGHHHGQQKPPRPSGRRLREQAGQNDAQEQPHRERRRGVQMLLDEVQDHAVGRLGEAAWVTC